MWFSLQCSDNTIDKHVFLQLGVSPLHVAAQNNHLEICEILLRAGISRDARTKVDRTPLHMAAYEGHLEIVETLLIHGADHDCRDLVRSLYHVVEFALQIYCNNYPCTF